MMRKWCFLLGCLWVMQGSAEVLFSEGKICIQQVSKPELYVFCSKKQTTLILDRVEFDRSASAGWSTQLAPFMCTVFYTDKSPFIFSCSQESSAAWQAVVCGQYVLASRFPWEGALLSKEMPTGSYWVAENIATDDVPMVVRHKGFGV